MKLNNKGFAISTIMYMILIMAVVLMVLTLALFSSRKLILDKTKEVAKDNIYSTSKLPSLYQEVEYIESTGTQYIDTGVIPNQNTGFDIIYLTKSTIGNRGYGSIMGARTDSKVNELQLTTYTENTSQYQGVFRYIDSSYNAGISANKKMRTTLIGNNYSSGSLTPMSFSLGYKFEASVPITVFALNENGTVKQHGKSQLYSLKLYNGNTLIRNFVPCYRKKDGVIGLFDTVQNRFYTNLGTENFKKGKDIFRLPDLYQKVEYIESTGTQYIDTGVIPNQDTGFDIIYLTKDNVSNSGYGAVMGAREKSSYNELQLTTYVESGYQTSTFGTLRWGTITSDNSMSSSYNAGITSNTKMHSVLKNKVYTKNDGSVINLNGTFKSPVSLTIFVLNNNGAITQHGKVQLYSLKLYDGNTLIRNFVPCYRKKDNVIGLYDVVNDVFYTNSGIGVFIKGNNI